MLTVPFKNSVTAPYDLDVLTILVSLDNSNTREINKSTLTTLSMYKYITLAVIPESLHCIGKLKFFSICHIPYTCKNALFKNFLAIRKSTCPHKLDDPPIKNRGISVRNCTFGEDI